MDTNKIRILLQILKSGSMLRAADELGYTPSGLAHLLDSVEQELGIALVSRGRFGTRLTPQGEQLYPLLCELADVDSRIRQQIALLNSGKTEIIRIGAYASIARHWLPDILHEYRQSHPKIEISTVVNGREELYADLRAGRLDLLFGCSVPSYPHEFWPLAKDYYRAVLPPDYATRHADAFDLTDFENSPFIMPSFGRDTDVMRVLDEHQIAIRQMAAYADDPVVLGMVAGNLGVSMLSDLALTGASERVKILPLSPQPDRVLGIAARRFAELSPAARAFAKYAAERLKSEEFNETKPCASS